MFRAIAIGPVTIALLASGVMPACAELKDEDLQRGSTATALVELANRAGFGTAFCVSEEGYFVTNRHVVAGVRVGGQVNIVIAPGTKDDKPIVAQVVEVSETDDLALLHAPKAKGTPALELGDSSALRETMPVTVFGYPFGDLLAVERQRYPNVSVNVGRISALRGERKAPSLIQTDALLNPGNSGGPMLNENGQVIGVIVSGLQNAGITLAIPVNKVKAMLQRPRVKFEMTDVAHDARYNPVELQIETRPIVPGFGDVESVSVQVARADQAEIFQAKNQGNDRYTAQIVPLDKPDGPPRWRIEVEYSDGLLRGLAADNPIKIGQQVVTIGQLHSIERTDAGFDVKTLDGKSFAGSLADPADLAVAIAGRDMKMDLRAARRLVVLSQVTEPLAIAVTVTAKTKDGQTVSKSQTVRILDSSKPATGVARIEGRKSKSRPPTSSPLPPEKLTGEPLVIDLPEPFAAVRSGGSGRYLVFHQPKERELAVFDVEAHQIVKQLPVPSDQVLYAAGREKLLVVLPGERLVQRWDLATLTRERMVPLPGAKTPLQVLMGSAGDGPLWLWSGGAIEAFDIERMQSTSVDGPVLGGDASLGYSMLISSDGSSVTGWHNGLSSPPYDLMRVHGHRTSVSSSPFGEGYNGRWMWPNANGALIFGHGARVFDHRFQPVAANWLEGGSIVPASDPRFFLLVTPDGGSHSKVSICTSNDRRIIYTASKLENICSDSHLEWGRIGGEPRAYYIPSAKMLIILPLGEEQVVLRGLDLPGELEERGSSYLYVDSFAPVQAYRGQEWRYQISAHSSRGQLTYKLESGPVGMIVAEDGLVAWNIPARYKDDSVAAIVSIQDATGQQGLHTIRFDVIDEPQ